MAAAAPPRSLTVTATAPQLLQLAERFLKSGDTAKAKVILAALTADPSSDIRNEARFRTAKLLAGEGQTSRAALLLRQVIDERPDALPARLELAGLLDRMGDKDGAWRQVRAAQALGLPPAVARIVDRYSEALRAQRPFGASLEIALAPDSNINRATRSDTLGTVLGDFAIDRDGKAKSGTGLALSAQAYRRLPLGEDASLLVRLTGFGNLYRQKQFNDVAADIAAGPELNLGRNRIQAEVGLTQRWFGQKRIMRSARIGAIVSHPLGRRTLLRLSGSAALVDNQLNDLQDGKSFSGQLSAEHALSATTGIAASFGVDRASLKDPGYSTTGWRAGLTGWRDFGRVTLSAGAEFGRLHADERLLLFPDKREDRSLRLSLGATFRQLQFRGFAPVARFSIERNRSSIAFYDYRRTRTELGFVRAF
jgi:hypothetical protein